MIGKTVDLPDTHAPDPEPTLPPHLSAVRYQAEELAFYVMTLLQHGVPAEMAERLALRWLDRRHV